MRAEGFTADAGIRGGRPGNRHPRARLGPTVGRVDYHRFSGGNLGLSGYWGRAGQGDPNLGDVAVTVAAIDTKLSRFGLTLRGQLSYIYISDVERLNQCWCWPSRKWSVSRQLLGGYVELSRSTVCCRENEGMQLPGLWSLRAHRYAAGCRRIGPWTCAKSWQ